MAASIALTAVLGVTLVLTLPILIPLAGLSHYQYGVVAGMGVYAVPQVLAAAFPVSDLSGEIATTVKLGRVMLLGPIVLIVGLVMTTLGAGAGAPASAGPRRCPGSCSGSSCWQSRGTWASCRWRWWTPSSRSASG